MLMNYHHSCKDKFFFHYSGFGSVNLCPPSLHISKGVMVDAEQARQTGRQMGLKERNNNTSGAV